MTDLTNPLPKLDGWGEPGTRLPRFNLRITSRQGETLIEALGAVDFREAGYEASYAAQLHSEVDALKVALLTALNGSPTPEVVADLSIAPEVTWDRFGGQACAD